jgi:hypothetical protein
MFDPATFGAALTSLKAIIDLARNANDAQLAMRISSEVATIQGRLIDVQQQALALQAENQELKVTIQSFSDDKAFEESLEFDPRGLYKRDGTNGSEYYCSACWDSGKKRIRVYGKVEATGTAICQFHGARY